MRWYVLMIGFFCHSVFAEVRLSQDFSKDPYGRVKDAAGQVMLRMMATPNRSPDTDSGFIFHLNGKKGYVQPSLFMAKSRPEEVCHPVSNPPLAYRCEEGQPFVKGCHLLFFNERLEHIGHHELQINELAPYYCNAVPAMGVYDKATDRLLVTVQYFIPAAHRGAKTVAELGQGWQRMTILFKVKENNGRIEVEQDDRCLGNPNRIDTIPDARQKLRQCELRSTR